MQEQLRKVKSWEKFTRLFLHVHRGAIDFKDAKVLADALWIAPHLLDHPASSCLPEFETFLLRYPVSALDTAEWRPYVTRLVDHNPALITKVDKTKKSFYERCQTKVPAPVQEVPKQPADPKKAEAVELASMRQPTRAAARELKELPKQPAAAKKATLVELAPRRQPTRVAARALESMVRDYALNDVIVILDQPDQIRAKIKEMLSNKPISVERLESVLSLLDMIPGEYELWTSFFAEIHNYDKKFLESVEGPKLLELLRKGWIIWKKTHPLEDFKPEFSRSWQNAIGSFLYKSTGTSDLWVSFMQQDAVRMIQRMEGENCKKFSKLCLEMGALYSWNEIVEDVNGIVHVLGQIVDRCKDACSGMEPEFQARVALLLCHHPDPVIQEKGELLFTQNIQANQTESEILKIYFILYCLRPFIPRNPENFMLWIHNCWASHKAKLDLDEVCGLTKAVFQFPFKAENENARHRSAVINRPASHTINLYHIHHNGYRKEYYLRYARTVFALDAFEDSCR